MRRHHILKMLKLPHNYSQLIKRDLKTCYILKYQGGQTSYAKKPKLEIEFLRLKLAKAR